MPATREAPLVARFWTRVSMDARLVGPRQDARPDALVLDPICVWPDGGLRGATCSRNLRVLDLRRSSPICFVDVVVSVGQTGTLTYDCAGGGAIVDFGRATFRGAFDGARVDVCIGTSLRFDYVESPAPGQRGCLTPCTATATIAVE